MDFNPLEAYIKCTRIVFSVEPSDNWEEFDEFEQKLCDFYQSLICNNCGQILREPCVAKLKYLSCQHRVCLDCIGKNRMTASNCKMCRDFTLFEKSHQTKLVLDLFQELCELIKGSWIYDYIQRRTKPDTGQGKKLNLTEIIENGINYGQTPIVLDDSSSSVPSSGDENSNSSMVKDSSPLHAVPYSSQVLTTFPSISPLAPISPQIVQSPEPLPQPSFTTILSEPVQTYSTMSSTIPQVSSQLVSQIVTQYPIIQQSPAVQQQIQLPSTSKVAQPLLKTPSYVPQVSPVRVKPMQSVKSIMSPMKIHQQAPTIYSVMYTGSGNKITLKRKTPSDEQVEPINNSSNNNDMNLIKTESVSSNFKTSTLQMTNSSGMQPMITQQQQIPIVTPIPSTAPSISLQNQQQPQNHANNPNEKRRGCRCGNATAAPGKLTCCGQRCPCYVDSKACVDCKCRGCRNPHFADGQKKLRHFVPDLQAQQQQQQSFLASLQKSAASVSLIKSSSDEISLLEQSTATTTTVIGKNSINNCIISMNSNGQYQIKPRIIMKEPTKTTLSPLIFPTTSATNSSIQILGLYSQVPMMTSSSIGGDKKIIIKSEVQSQPVVTFTDVKPHLLEPSANNFNANLNSNIL